MVEVRGVDVETGKGVQNDVMVRLQTNPFEKGRGTGFEYG